MEALSFRKNYLQYVDLQGYPHVPLFNDLRHVKINNSLTTVDFCLLDEIDNLYAYIVFSIDHEIAYSPWQSLFGGLVDIHKTDFLDRRRLLVESCKKLGEMGVQEVRITLPASLNNEDQHDLKVYLQEGFEILYSSINHHITISPSHLAELMHSMELRKLKKCQERGFNVQVLSIAHLAETYSFIQTQRAAKGIPVNISFEKLAKSIELFPDRYFLIGAFDGDKMIAATVLVKVNNMIMYNFLPASSADYNQFSPMVLLLSEVYNHARLLGASVLDLGLSAVGNERQEGLSAFKLRMGAQESIKYALVKMLK